MPGRGSYGPGGAWIYRRAKHIRSKNPDMDESTSFAIATQQAHKLGKSPKKFRTEGGVARAHAKYRGPAKMYKKTASVATGTTDSGRFCMNMLEYIKTAGITPEEHGDLSAGLLNRRERFMAMTKEAISKKQKAKIRNRRRAAKNRNKPQVQKPPDTPPKSARPKPASKPNPSFAPTLKGRDSGWGKIPPATTSPKAEVKPSGGGWQAEGRRATAKSPGRLARAGRYALPAAGLTLGALGVAHLIRKDKKNKADIEAYFKKKAQAMLPSSTAGAASPGSVIPKNKGNVLTPQPPQVPGGGVEAAGMPQATMGT